MPQLPNTDLSRGNGYDLQKGVPVNNTENLPQKIAVVAEMNTANQSTPVTPIQITSRAQAAALYGWGSPMDIKMRILFGNVGVNGIPVWAYPVASSGATYNQQIVAVSGTATANVTHTLLIGGRSFLESGSYQLNITNGMTAAQVSTLIQNTVNGVLGCPMAAGAATGILTSIIHSGSAGSGYAANDLFNVVNATTGAVLATGKVLTVSTGAVATYSILTPGYGYSVATNIATVATSGAGTGFAIDITALTTGSASLISNWKGLTAEDITVNVLTYQIGQPAIANPAGLSYTVTEISAGTGTPNLTTTLAKLQQNGWNTIVDSGWGILNTTANGYYITYNGNANTQSGQYAPLQFTPAIYVAGNVTDSTTVSADTAITEALLNEMTIAVGSAPLSLGLPMEAASNYVVNFANISNNTPNIDIQAIPLPDMPGPLPGSAAPAQNSNYSLRNALMQDGMTTVKWSGSAYYPQDFVTTYAPAGEYPPAFRYPRDLMIDYNVEFKYKKIIKSFEGYQIAKDNDIVTAPKVIKPKDIVGLLTGLAYDLVAQGFISDAKAMISSISVTINSTNVNRFDISFSYNRSGVTRVISNVATANP